MMKEERMKVLEMLEKQVINADEAQRLLELLTCKSDKAKDSAYCFAEDFSGKAEAFGDKVESAVKEFAQNLESMAKNVEPKLRKATQIIIEKTVSTVDEVSKAFHDEECNCGAEKGECDCGQKTEDEDDTPKEN